VAVPYILFLASGSICMSAMNAASFEALYSAFSRMHVQKTWDGIMNAPVRLDDIVLAEMLWAAFKALFTVTAILGVMLALGISHSPKLLLAWPVLLGVGITFSCIALIFNALAKGYDFFTYYFTLFLTPMMFLSGIFFPLRAVAAAGAQHRRLAAADQCGRAGAPAVHGPVARASRWRHAGAAGLHGGCVLARAGADPATAQFYRLHLRYLRTETTGAAFEAMKAQLAGIASHSGMADVFTLRGSDIYAVLAIESIDGEPLPAPPARCGMLGAVRCCSERLARAGTMDEAAAGGAGQPHRRAGRAHAMVLMLDEAAQRLYTVASCGYATSGVGSEIAVGDGVIGVAARERTPVRILHMTNAYLYSSAVRSSLRADAPAGAGHRHPLSGPGPAAQPAGGADPVGRSAAGRALRREPAGPAVQLRGRGRHGGDCRPPGGDAGAGAGGRRAGGGRAGRRRRSPAAPSGATLVVRRYTANDSIFVNDAYLIKGVAGAIFWKLVRDYSQQGRTEFTNRELRLDGALGLPDITDNLEARLLLLQRRLAEQARGVHIEKTGRGRFRLAGAPARSTFRTFRPEPVSPPARARPARPGCAPALPTTPSPGACVRRPWQLRRQAPARAAACRRAPSCARRGSSQGPSSAASPIISCGGIDATSASWIAISSASV
jgi:adenylate cyclase